MIRLDIKKITTQGSLNFQLEQLVKPTDNSNLYTNILSLDEINKNTNAIVDSEKAKFKPLKNYLIFSLKKPSNDAITYGDLGFSDDDLKFNRNRFKFSFLNLVFTDSPNPNNQNFVFEQRIYCQRNEFLFDGNGNIKSAGDISVIFKLAEPFNYSFTQGYFLYYKKDDIFPRDLYLYISFNNALSGVSTPFLSVNSILTANELLSKRYLKYTLVYSPSGSYYTIDDTDREVSTTTDTLNVDLYEKQ